MTKRLWFQIPEHPSFLFLLLIKRDCHTQEGATQMESGVGGSTSLPSKADVPEFLFSSASMTSSIWKQMV